MNLILVLGETILDMTPVGSTASGESRFETALGGSAYNTARALGALGARVAFAGAVSRDSWGARFRAALVAKDVDCALLRNSEKPMPLALVSPEGAHGPAFTLYLAGTAHEDAQAPDARPEGVAHVHVSSFHACVPPTGAGVLALMGKARGGASVSFDPNIRPSVLPPRADALALVEERVRLSDIVKASAQDMRWLYPALNPLDAMAAWSGMGPRLAVLTKGELGVTAFTADGRFHALAPAVDVVDTVGAGDAFTAALLAEMARGGALGPDAAPIDPEALRRWLTFASACAAWTCARRGAQAPGRKDIALPGFM
ncbi:MAG: carbohydrate kinase [Beijerinckiaceae bacterium]|nr:carbohydrate kinase [Beijerinckiaceae bacterium]